MNFAKNFKWQLVLAGLGFSLVLTARANSQEIVNTDFATPAASVGSNFNNAAPTDMNTTAAVTPQSVYTPANSISARANNDMQQLNAASLPLPRKAGVLLSLAVLMICCTVVWKASANRREDARKPWIPSLARPQRLPSRKPQPIHS